MAEIPAGEYTSHIHRSIDQLRQMNEKNAAYTLGALGTTDLRLHDYKPYTDLRADRIDYSSAVANAAKHHGMVDDRNGNNNNNNNISADGQHGEPVDQKPFIGSPNSPPTPLSINDAHMNEAKVSEEHILLLYLL